MRESYAKHIVYNFEERSQKIQALKERFLSIAKDIYSPLFCYDSEELALNYNRFKDAFHAAGIPVDIYYALKSNPYRGVLESVVKLGGYLDVSSPFELERAKEVSPKRIVYTGPGKTEKDFEAILGLKDTEVIIHLESLTELHRLGAVTKRLSKKALCGVRVITSAHARWNKFGIPLETLKEFLEVAAQYPLLSIQGIQFHISFIMNADPYLKAFQEIRQYLENSLSPAQYRAFKFIDIGGGIYPEVFIGDYPWNPDGVLYLDDKKIIQRILEDEFRPPAAKISVTPIEDIARGIGDTLKEYILPLIPDIKIFAEPGRYLCHSVLHTLMTVLDIKRKDAVIVDAGGNMVGWERYQFLHYAPIFNLSQFSLNEEFPCIVYGPLCTPDDVWGYYVHGKSIALDDVLLLPYQGEYNYTLAQKFIRDFPRVYNLWEDSIFEGDRESK